MYAFWKSYWLKNQSILCNVGQLITSTNFNKREKWNNFRNACFLYTSYLYSLKALNMV